MLYHNNAFVDEATHVKQRTRSANAQMGTIPSRRAKIAPTTLQPVWFEGGRSRSRHQAEPVSSALGFFRRNGRVSKLASVPTKGVREGRALPRGKQWSFQGKPIPRLVCVPKPKLFPWSNGDGQPPYGQAASPSTHLASSIDERTSCSLVDPGVKLSGSAAMPASAVWHRGHVNPTGYGDLIARAPIPSHTIHHPTLTRQRTCSLTNPFHSVGTQQAGFGRLCRGDCAGLRGGCAGLRGDCAGLRGGCAGLRGYCAGLRGGCAGLRGGSAGLRARYANLAQGE